MILSTRERNIAIASGVAVALLILWLVVVSPFLQQNNDVDSQLKQSAADKNDAEIMLRGQARRAADWQKMQTVGGLKVDASLSESQALHALDEWSYAAGVSLGDVTERPSEIGNFKTAKFQLQTFSATATGDHWQIENLLWKIENAPIPMRLSEIKINPQREDTDDLVVHFTVSALCLTTNSTSATPPAAPVSNATGATP